MSKCIKGVENLLCYGADFKLVNKFGKTPLQLAKTTCLDIFHLINNVNIVIIIFFKYIFSVILYILRQCNSVTKLFTVFSFYTLQYLYAYFVSWRVPIEHYICINTSFINITIHISIIIKQVF